MTDSNLTQQEARALPVLHNLSDGHAYRPWTASEMDIIQRSPSLFLRADRREHVAIEKAYLTTFFEFSEQSWLPQHYTYLPMFTASASIELVANYLRRKGMSVSLIEPCFDNLADILRRHDLALHAIDDAAISAGGEIFRAALAEGQSDAIFLVLPNNPTGTDLDMEAFANLLDYCLTNAKLLILDTCFRFYTADSMIFDQYAMVAASGVDCIFIEDTGKTWPTVELKAPFLSVTPRLAPDLARIHSDYLLHVSPFTLLLVTQFIQLAQPDRGRYMKALVASNRDTLNLALRGTLITCIDTGRLSVSWLRIDHPAINGPAIRSQLAIHGVEILDGRSFFWKSPERGDQFLRVALVRDSGLFSEAALIVRRVLDDMQ